jgi:hypothetical protein
MYLLIIFPPSFCSQNNLNQPTPDRPWESIYMDYMAGLPSTKHANDCVFVVIDRFSKMAVLATCKKSITTWATVELLFEHVWVHFWIP